MLAALGALLLATLLPLLFAAPLLLLLPDFSHQAAPGPPLSVDLGRLCSVGLLLALVSVDLVIEEFRAAPRGWFRRLLASSGVSVD